jgi:hypothetical protein
MGPLMIAQGNYKYIVDAIEYFTKWIEAKPLVNIAATELKRFFWQNIICRFGCPKRYYLITPSSLIATFLRISAIKWESKQLSSQFINRGKCECTDILCNQENLGRPTEGQVGGRVAEGSMEP